jgi:hypothetical protein
LQAPQSAPASDGYLNGLSNQSLEVIQHFGTEAPVLLNSYACVLEDSLLNQVAQTQEARQIATTLHEQLGNAHNVIIAAAEDNAAYQTLLSTPALLANYTNEFFGPNGVYPVETAQDRLRAEVEAGERGQSVQRPAVYQQAPQQAQPQYQQALPLAAPQYQQAPPQAAPQQPQPMVQYQRPQMEIQAPVQAVSGYQGSAINEFSSLYDQDPAAAAHALYSMNPNDLAAMLRQKGAMIGE